MKYKNRIILKSYIFKNNQIFIYDGKNVTYDLNHNEIDCAKWIIDNFGGIIYILPKINIPNGIKTADYLYQNKFWDLKTIFSSGKRIIDNRIKSTRDQTSNYVIDISPSNLEIYDAINQILKIFNDSKRYWVNTIILKSKSEFIFIFTKKGMPPSQITAEDHSITYFIQ